MSRLLFTGFVGMTLVLGGCQFYQPHPLTTATVEQALTPPPPSALRVQAQQLNHPILKPVELDFDRGLSPDAAAILAVLLNPGLRAARDQRGLADAQLLQAGLLPNPQVSLSIDKPAFGSTAGTVTAYGVGLSVDLQQLITHAARQQAARRQRSAVDLDLAWQEWQAAQAARTAVYQLTALEAQTELSASLDQRLNENLDLVRRAIDAGQMTELDLAAAETARNQAHANLLALQQHTAQQRLALNRLLGVSPDTTITLQADIALPDHLDVPPAKRLLDGLEQRRLDLVALQRGYASQESAVRAAILAQFPRISFGVQRARDTGNVGTMGLGVTLDLPVFDHNQGAIAQERATRQQLFDEYVNRVFEARAQIAKLLTDARWLNAQIAAARASEPGLDRLVQTYRLAVNAGQADVLSYYTAWNTLTEKQIDVLTLQWQLADTRTALELASGLYRLDAASTQGTTEKGK
jgi:outer membrane protein, heavy metal efflux system